MNKNILSRNIPFKWLSLLIVVTIGFTSCSKKGTMESIPEFSKLTLEIWSEKLSPVLFNVKIDGLTFKDSLEAGISANTGVVERTGKAQRLKITELYSNAVLVDTMLTIPPGDVSYRIYQIDTTEFAKPLFVDAKSTSDLPVDTFMLAFYTKDPLLPELFDLYVYKVIDFTYVELPPIHIYKSIRKGEFTQFHPLYMGGYYMYEIRTPNGEMVKDMMPIDPANPFGGGGMFDNRCYYDVNNHQVMKITATDVGDGTYNYALECLFMY